MLGVDYSSAAVALARRVAVASRHRRPVSLVGKETESVEAAGLERTRQGGNNEEEDGEVGHGEEQVEFMEWDIIASPLSAILTGEQCRGWDVVLDKGTFDAISLNGERDQAGRRMCERYRDRVMSLVRDGGIFLITSCNWTEDELRDWFENGARRDDDAGVQEKFVPAGRVQYRSFTFGGLKGQAVSTLCFKKEKARD